MRLSSPTACIVRHVSNKEITTKQVADLYLYHITKHNKKTMDRMPKKLLVKSKPDFLWI